MPNPDLPKVLLITTLYNRHKCIERALSCFLRQDYPGEHTMFIYNSGGEQTLGKLDLPDNKHVILVNNGTDLVTKGEYKNVGDKYRDALSLIQGADDYDIVSHYDSDDIILPNHIGEGVIGMLRARKEGMSAYKPHFSFLRTQSEVSLIHNVCEGSIFIGFDWVVKYGYGSLVVKYHDSWLHPLIEQNKILVDKKGKSTWCYTWGEEIPVYKTSGGGENEQNFINSQKVQNDTGDGVIDILPLGELNKYYLEIEQFNGTLTTN